MFRLFSTPCRRITTPFLLGCCALTILGLAANLATGRDGEPPTEPSGSPDRLSRLEEQLWRQQAEVAALREKVRVQSEQILRLPAVDDGQAEPSPDESTPVEDGAPQYTSAGTFAAPAPAGEKKPAGDDVTKRVAELEKQLKKRDEADKKAAADKAATEFPSWRITGFTQLDTAYYAQDRNNINTVGEAQDGAGIRRLRLAVQGKVAEFTNYQLEVDFATAGRPSFFDNYIDQGNLPWLNTIRIGQFCQPFSVDAMSGFRNLPFLERSLPFLALVPFRRVGIQSSNMSENERTAWAGSLYRTGGFNNAPLGDDRFATDFGQIGGYSFSGRMTHLMQYDEFAGDRYLWHVGGGYNFSELGANTAPGAGTTGNAGSPVPFYQSRVLPEFGVLGYPENSSNFGSAVNGTPAFADTGRYRASNYHLFGAETVYQAGAFGFQAEYMATIVNSIVGPVTYQGGYVQGTYRLTGEHRLYDKKSGTFGKVIPFADFIPLKQDGIAGWGAWEVGARWSIIDLRNPANMVYLAGSNSAGNGVVQDTTVGGTWFLNAYTKLQFNWIHVMLQNTKNGFSDADLFVSRAQVDF